MTTLIIATRNAHKVEEIRGILGPEFKFQTLRDFPAAPVVIEDANTFSGNATKKSVELARFLTSFNMFPSSSAVFVLADDSGLEVDALNGAPGVHSARFAAMEAPGAGNASDADNNAKLLRMLKEVPANKRTARFRCVLALTPLLAPTPAGASPVCTADEHELATELFNGTCEGEIAFAPSGAKGFGYDPLFVPTGFQQSFAELGDEVKSRISHRAKALDMLRDRMARRQD